MGEIYWLPTKFTFLGILGLFITLDSLFFILAYNSSIYFINNNFSAIRYAGYGLIAMWIVLTIFTMLFYVTRRELLSNSLVLLYKSNRINFREIYDNIEVFLRIRGIKYSCVKKASEEFFLFRPLKELVLLDYNVRIFIFPEKLYIFSKDVKGREKVRNVLNTFIRDLITEKNYLK